MLKLSDVHVTAISIVTLLGGENDSTRCHQRGILLLTPNARAEFSLRLLFCSVQLAAMLSTWPFPKKSVQL